NETIQLCLSLVNVDSIFESSNCTWKNSLRAYRRTEWICRESSGGPHVDVVSQGLAGVTKSWRHCADNRVEVRVRINFTTKNVWITTKETFPKSVADDDTFGKTLCLLFFRSEYTTELSARVQQCEVIRTDGQ